jgi:pimeloyl-ACP methyl ester carboxylesterase
MLPHFNRLSMDEFGFEFQTPIFMFMGRYDLHTAYACARDFFKRIQAPHKKFITFERSAHFPMMEEPGRVLMALVNEVLPLAGEPVQYERLADAPE